MTSEHNLYLLVGNRRIRYTGRNATFYFREVTNTYRKHIAHAYTQKRDFAKIAVSLICKVHKTANPIRPFNVSYPMLLYILSTLNKAESRLKIEPTGAKQFFKDLAQVLCLITSGLYADLPIENVYKDIQEYFRDYRGAFYNDFVVNKYLRLPTPTNHVDFIRKCNFQNN